MTAIQFLLAANVLGYLLELSFGPALSDAFALWVDSSAPFAELLSAPWQWITYSFLHASPMHLLLNLFALWMFGSDVERVWGARRLLFAYFAAVVSGALVQTLAAVAVGGLGGPVVGASAGVFGLLLVFALLFPQRTIVLLFPPIPLPARTFVFGYAALELVLGVTGTAAGVAHFAHLGGLLGGWLVYRYRARLARPGR